MSRHNKERRRRSRLNGTRTTTHPHARPTTILSINGRLYHGRRRLTPDELLRFAAFELPGNLTVNPGSAHLALEVVRDRVAKHGPVRPESTHGATVVELYRRGLATAEDVVTLVACPTCDNPLSVSGTR